MKRKAQSRLTKMHRSNFDDYLYSSYPLQMQLHSLNKTLEVLLIQNNLQRYVMDNLSPPDIYIYIYIYTLRQ